MNLRPGRTSVLALWALACLAAAVLVGRTQFISDLSAFLPAHPTPMQRLLVDQLREGPAARLILCAVDGGSADARAAASSAVAARLRADPQFTAVDAGTADTAERDRQFLFQHRYALSPAVTPARFTAPGLRQAIAASLDELAAPAGLLLKSLFPHDPTGEMLEILDGFESLTGPRRAGGVYVGRDGSRALLVATTRAEGSDTDGQARAQQAILQAFAAVPPGAGLRLRMSGPGVFAVAARAHIERVAVRLSIASSLLIVALLLVVYRSLRAVALGLLPVATAALAGVAATAAVFGAVHAITFGFGVTLIGESVDYSIYYFMQSRQAAAWREVYWPTVRLGMLTSVCGFASLLPSGFPGLAQLGVYSIAGLLAAAAVTRFVLPALTPAQLALRDLAPLGTAATAMLSRVRRPRLCLLVLFAAAVTVVVQHRHSLWNHELSSLSPVSADDQAFDAGLRADLGAADVRDLVIVTGESVDAALAAAERAAAALRPLVDRGVINGFDSPASFLPSRATQSARQASLPDAPTLRTTLAAATADLPVAALQLDGFLRDVAQARAAPPLVAADLAGTSFAAGYAGLTLRSGDVSYALMPLHAPTAEDAGIDTTAVQGALAAAGVNSATVLDLKREADALYAGYLREALRLSACGLAGVVLLLSAALRSVRRVGRILLPLALAVVCVAALLAASGRELSILHLVGLLLIVAVGSNYALFFDRDDGADRQTMASLLLANASTVIGFGLLALSNVPVLEALGMTVAPGALLALLFSALLSRPRHAQPV